MKLTIIPAAALLAGCASYTVPMPADFSAAATHAVAGASGFNQRSMTIGEYAVSIERGSTRERGGAVTPVSTARKQQEYSFTIERAGRIVFSGGCMLMARATNIGAPGGVQIVAQESAELDCELLPGGSGSTSWSLQLSGDPDNPLNGHFTGAARFALQGIGTAIGSTRHGPTGGYYIKQDDRVIAVVQTTSPRQLHMSAAVPAAHTEAIVAAATVLLLVDESVRDLD